MEDKKESIFILITFSICLTVKLDQYPFLKNKNTCSLFSTKHCKLKKKNNAQNNLLPNGCLVFFVEEKCSIPTPFYFSNKLWANFF